MQVHEIVQIDDIEVRFVIDDSHSTTYFNIGMACGYCDQTEAPIGLAHLCEHLILHPPQQTAFAEKLKRCNGQFNGLTSDEYSMFSVHCQTSHFTDILADFCEFFLQTELNWNALESEIEAIENEYIRNRNDDGRRLIELQRTLQSEPIRAFNCGSKASLTSVPQNQLQRNAMAYTRRLLFHSPVCIDIEIGVAQHQQQSETVKGLTQSIISEYAAARSRQREQSLSCLIKPPVGRHSLTATQTASDTKLFGESKQTRFTLVQMPGKHHQLILSCRLPINHCILNTTSRRNDSYPFDLADILSSLFAQGHHDGFLDHGREAGWFTDVRVRVGNQYNHAQDINLCFNGYQRGNEGTRHLLSYVLSYCSQLLDAIANDTWLNDLVQHQTFLANATRPDTDSPSAPELLASRRRDALLERLQQQRCPDQQLSNLENRCQSTQNTRHTQISSALSAVLNTLLSEECLVFQIAPEVVCHHTTEGYGVGYAISSFPRPSIIDNSCYRVPNINGFNPYRERSFTTPAQQPEPPVIESDVMDTDLEILHTFSQELDNELVSGLFAVHYPLSPSNLFTNVVLPVAIQALQIELNRTLWYYQQCGSRFMIYAHQSGFSIRLCAHQAFFLEHCLQLIRCIGCTSISEFAMAHAMHAQHKQWQLLNSSPAPTGDIHAIQCQLNPNQTSAMIALNELSRMTPETIRRSLSQLFQGDKKFDLVFVGHLEPSAKLIIKQQWLKTIHRQTETPITQLLHQRKRLARRLTLNSLILRQADEDTDSLTCYLQTASANLRDRAIILLLERLYSIANNTRRYQHAPSHDQPAINIGLLPINQLYGIFIHCNGGTTEMARLSAVAEVHSQALVLLQADDAEQLVEQLVHGFRIQLQQPPRSHNERAQQLWDELNEKDQSQYRARLLSDMQRVTAAVLQDTLLSNLSTDSTKQSHRALWLVPNANGEAADWLARFDGLSDLPCRPQHCADNDLHPYTELDTELLS